MLCPEESAQKLGARVEGAMRGVEGWQRATVVAAIESTEKRICIRGAEKQRHLPAPFKGRMWWRLRGGAGIA